MPNVTWSQLGCAAWLPLLLATALVSGAQAQDSELGKRVFTSGTAPPCALCHTLAAADASGEIGPNLDELKPTEERVRRAVEQGVGNMPPFGETLSEEQIAAVSRFVAKAVR
jgi:cytochrome c6